jgi:Uma2 family endonuclease
MTITNVLPVVTPADHVAGPSQGLWTYTDYAALPDDGHRYEIIEGVLYMPPSPNEAHQSASRWFVFYLTTHVHLTGLGRVYSAPFDVELVPNVVVQPDVIVVLHTNQGVITPSHIIGVPDLLIEIASPGTVGYDRRTKQDTYARAGVPEYWIADPAARTVELLQLHQRAYHSLGVFQGQALLPSRVVPGLPVRVEQFFA